MEKKKRSAAVTVAVMTLITLGGKLLGLVRDRLLTVNYGSGMEANAFLTASRIPRVFFDTVFSSAIAACLIPVMGEVMEKRGKKEALRFAGNFMTVMALICAVVTVLGTVFAGPLTRFFADGFDSETALLCARLTRIMMPTVLFTGVAFSFVGVLQSFDEFNVPAAISLVSNAAVILYYVLFNRTFGIFGLAVAYLAAWALQALVQIPALLKKGFRYYPSLSLVNPDMKKVWKLLLPVMVSTWVLPLIQTVNSKFGSRLFDGAGVSAVEYAFNLYTIVVGLFVFQVTNYIFPRLSRESASGDQSALRDTLRSAMHTTLFVVIPLTAGLFVMARPLVAFIYGGGKFDDFSIEITSRALRWMSLGMVGYTVQYVVARAWFAGQAGAVPLAAGVLSIAANVGLCSLLTPRFDVAGIAVASAVSFTVNAAVMAAPLKKRGAGFLDRAFLTDMAKLTLAAAVMALGAWGVLKALEGRAGKLLTLLLPTAAGIVLYALLAAAFKTDETVYLLKKLRKSPGGERR